MDNIALFLAIIVAISIVQTLIMPNVPLWVRGWAGGVTAWLIVLLIKQPASCLAVVGLG